MTLSGKLLAATPTTIGRSAKRILGGIVVALAVFGAPAPPARADQVSDAKAAQVAVEAQVVSAAGRIHQFTEAYDQANVQAQTLAQQLASSLVTLASLRRQEGANVGTLRREALLSYTGGLPTAGAVLTTSGADPAIREEYLTVALGDVAESVDQLQLGARQVLVAEAGIRTQQQATQQAVQATARARQDALGQAASAQAALSRAQAQVDQLVAAVASTAARQTAVVSASSAGPAANGAQGLPVNNGLVDVVRQVVGPAPASSPAPTVSGPAAPASAAPAASPTTSPVTAPPATAPPAIPTTLPPVTTPPSATGGDWQRLRECESGDNYQENTGNGYYGAYQFSQATWSGLGYPGRPDQEPPALQDAAAMRLQSSSGWGAWPACSAALGL